VLNSTLTNFSPNAALMPRIADVPQTCGVVGELTHDTSREGQMTRRKKSITTKVTAEDYVQFAALAGTQTVSEWARAVLQAATRPPAVDLILAEVLALRTILLNLHFAVASGEPVTPQLMHHLIARADEQKTTDARQRIASLHGAAS
jgi:hypothetical protein